jgi:hypothetical protein
MSVPFIPLAFTNPQDEQISEATLIDDDPPCKHETFSGVCMVCGAGPDEQCGWEDRQ